MDLEKGNRILRLKIRWSDGVRNSVQLRRVRAYLLAIRGWIRRDIEKRLSDWAEAHRIALGLGFRSPSEAWLRPWVSDSARSGIWRERRIGWGRYDLTAHPGVLRKSLIAKLPDANEKGVLLIWFEYDLLKLLSAKELPELLNRYVIVFFSSWSPPYFPALWSFPIEYRSQLICGLSNPRDDEMIRSAGFEFRLLPLYMSSWQDPEDIRPLPRSERDVDIVMVANWAKFKRHWVLFEGLRQLNQPELRVVLIGQPESGRTVDQVRAEAEAFGVAGQIEFLNRLEVPEVWDWLCRSRVSLITSKREGSCVVVAESLMANTPVGLLEGAAIGSSAFINSETGIFLREGADFGRQLAEFLNAAGTMQPRHWAESHIGCESSRGRVRESFEQWREFQNAGEWFEICCRGTLSYREEPAGIERDVDREVKRLNEEHRLRFQLMKRGGRD